MLFLIGEFPTHLASRQSAATLIYGGDASQLNSDGYRTFKVVVSVLMAVHYSCNFILYCALNSKFLSMVSRVLLCLRAEPDLETSDLRVTASDPARGQSVRAQNVQRQSGQAQNVQRQSGQAQNVQQHSGRKQSDREQVVLDQANTGSRPIGSPKAHPGGNGHAL